MDVASRLNPLVQRILRWKPPIKIKTGEGKKQGERTGRVDALLRFDLRVE